MKNKKLLAALATLTLGGAMVVGAFTGCAHEHTYSDKWESDETGHWHCATCDDLKESDKDYKKGYAEHEWGGDDKCDVCNYERTPAVTEYTVTLNLGGGSLGSGVSNTLTTVGGKLTSLPTPTAPEGKEFKGWYTAATGGVKVDTTYTFTGDTKTVTIYAQYEDEKVAIEYTVTLDAHGGTLAGASTIKTVDGKITLPDAPTAAPELTFTGWYTAAEGGEKITADTVFDKDTTSHAQWKATDGIYTEAGKVIEALEWIAPGDSAKKQYGGTGIELDAGTEFVIKVEGTVLSHNAGTLELWLANDCHGINFDQATGKFTVKPGNARAFDIYAKYYDAGTPCWSIYISDGLKDELNVGGAYLVGGGWDGANWSIAADNYIDPENGITVNLSADADFKIVECLDVAEGDNRGWKYNDPKYYAVKDDAAGYLNFASVSGSGNAKVLAAGEYTVNVVGTGEDIKFVFTPAEGLEPAPVEDKFVKGGYYLAGSFAGGAWDVKEDMYIDPAKGLTVTLAQGSEFQVVGCKDSATGGAIWEYGAASYYRMAEGKAEGYTEIPGGNVKVIAAGQYTITIDDSGEKPVFVITPADDVEPNLNVEETVLHYYIKGSKVTNNWQELKDDAHELKETAAGSGIYEMTIVMEADDVFMFYSTKVGVETGNVSAGDKYIQSGHLAEGIDCVTIEGDNFKTVAAGTYTFSYNAETAKLTVTFVAAEA